MDLAGEISRLLDEEEKIRRVRHALQEEQRKQVYEELKSKRMVALKSQTPGLSDSGDKE